MKTLYLDLFSGISGDMFIGALLDLGVDAGQLEQSLASLGAAGYHLHINRARRQGIEGVQFQVHIGAHAHTHAHTHTHDHPGEAGHPHHQDHDHDHHDHDHSHSHDPGHSHPHSHEHEHVHGHGHEHSHAHGHEPSAGTHEHEHTHPHGTAVPPEHAHRTFADIRAMIGRSQLSPWVKERAVAVFARIAAAEGRIHGLPPDQVGFHEVGALDSIVDICGACLGLE
ncbi:DUF111 family protein, partial [bacterium]|nr:DUF111 family protein [bacterium]